MCIPLNRKPRLSTPLTSGVSRTGEWSGEISSPDEAADPRQQPPEPTRLPTVVFVEGPAHPEDHSRERAMLGEELATLNGPLDYELEYYDESVRRWPKLVSCVVAFMAAAGIAYLFAASQSAARRSMPAAPPLAVAPATVSSARSATTIVESAQLGSRLLVSSAVADTRATSSPAQEEPTSASK
jgi:hypothetical protein